MGTMRIILQNLAQKEVSRKEFLSAVGLATPSLFGLRTIIKLLTGKSINSHHVLSATAYDSSPYTGGQHTSGRSDL